MQIRKYHSAHYKPSNITIILQGQLDSHAIFKAISQVKLAPLDPPSQAENYRPWTSPIPPLLASSSMVVPFPSEGK